MTRRADLLAPAVARLRAAGIPDPQTDARVLLRWASGLSAAALGAALTDDACAGECRRFEAAVSARLARVPVAQIIGERLFWGRSFRVTRDVLDPRPETETLIAAALEVPARRVLDLGTGTGCLLLTLLAERPGATGLGTDVSAAALRVARENAERLGVADRAAFREADWWSGVAGSFDLVISNPPYIAAAEMATLAPEVRLHEPRGALTPGGDGLDAYRRIAAQAPDHLAPGGRLIVEVGAGQAAEVSALLETAGLDTVPAHRDLDGRDRAIIGRAPDDFHAKLRESRLSRSEKPL